MAKIFLISDTHFGHSNILTFKRADGSPLREFSSVQEMDETMIDNWNRVVSNSDKVYHLGDLTFSNRNLQEIMPRLNGTKVLIKGNHDNLKLSQYMQFFKDVRAYHVLDKMLLSHIPVHIDSMKRWGVNLHGHLHSNVISDKRYINLSVEQINYTPIDFEEIRERVKNEISI